MSTPLMDAANRYVAANISRFHMPGHKGQPLAGLGGISRYDLTEIKGLDSLYEAEEAIGDTEAAYTRLYGTTASVLSAGGSTLCIQTMLALAARPGSKLLAARGVHTAAVNAMALLDLHPVWMYPDTDPDTGLSLALSAGAVAQALRDHPDAAAVYLTSPTYFGVISDIAAISAVCREANVPLLVDNAHGSHLKFLSPSLHPVDLGADLCCDSLHKTLPVLTGGALLHLCNSRFVPRAKEYMSLFGSTSPSYLILLSADVALPYLQDGFPQEMQQVAARVSRLAQLAAQKGFLLPSGILEPMRLTLGFRQLGYTAQTFRAHLEAHCIEPEYLSDQFCVLMAAPGNSAADFVRVQSMLEGVTQDSPLPPAAVSIPQPQQALSLRQAAFRETRILPLEQAEGCIAGRMIAPCPPGIPLLISGEILDADVIRLLKKYGIPTVNVVK